MSPFCSYYGIHIHIFARQTVLLIAELLFFACGCYHEKAQTDCLL